MKFKIDENLPLEIKHLLNQVGHDALSVKDQGLIGRPDENLAAICVKEGRILVTCDLDFSDIRTYPPAKHPGIMVIRSDHLDKPTMLELFHPVLDLLFKEQVAKKLWIIEKKRIRMRG